MTVLDGMLWNMAAEGKILQCTTGRGGDVLVHCMKSHTVEAYVAVHRQICQCIVEHCAKWWGITQDGRIS